MRPSFLIISAICSGLGLAAPYTSAAVEVDEAHFRVSLDDKEIGFHTFTITREGRYTSVDIDANFNVRFLFINAYSYKHENIEIWEDGCLRRIDSQTDDNGVRFEVSGEQKESAFELVTLDTTTSVTHDCVKTFAYWDRTFLDQTRLLNAQTGKLLDVSIEPLGMRSFNLAGRSVAADGFHVLSEQDELSIKVWYTEANGKWLALESKVAGGRTLRYSPANAERLLSEAVVSAESPAE